jgi:hypothetical protein
MGLSLLRLMVYLKIYAAPQQFQYSVSFYELQAVLLQCSKIVAKFNFFSQCGITPSTVPFGLAAQLWPKSRSIVSDCR